MSIRIVITDDHHVVRQGLRLLVNADPEFEVVGEAANGEEAVELARQLRPDVVLMDLLMPGLGGVAATAAIRGHFPETEVLILTSMDEDRGVVEAVRAGAIGYLRKDIDASDLRYAVKAAVAGRVQLSPRAAMWLMREVRSADNHVSLTAREHDVMLLLTRGSANKEIAHDLLIAETTVKSHVRHILAKLGVESRTQAVLHATRTGLVPVTSLGQQVESTNGCRL